ncbi:hypothetical protein SAMN05444008_114144 [Cnuella takakiae]|uniref:Uncharacterized protein n=1 Tax=Cnuella takakiae TaxID=1302690 RepID=A0A1M5FTR6_9BACT|nr:hypothetical protein SAMN05444008_114144 [Cnuella takakiae]
MMWLKGVYETQQYRFAYHSLPIYPYWDPSNTRENLLYGCLNNLQLLISFRIYHQAGASLKKGWTVPDCFTWFFLAG